MPGNDSQSNVDVKVNVISLWLLCEDIYQTMCCRLVSAYRCTAGTATTLCNGSCLLLICAMWSVTVWSDVVSRKESLNEGLTYFVHEMCF